MAQVTRSAHASSVSTKLADNTTGAISEQDVREVVTDLEDSAVWRNSGAGAPGTTPEAVGDTYLDTTNDLGYIAVDTSSSADWKPIVLGAATQTLTNKTIDSASNTLTLDMSEGTLTGTTAEFNTALSDGSFATLAGTETLTNKTIAYASNTVTGLPVEFVIAASDETTDLTTGTAKVTFRMPHAMTLTGVRASVNTAPAGSTIIVDINEGGTSVLSTKLTIDASEKTSTTAATAAVISDSALADDAEMTVDIDQIGSSTAGAGLKVALIGTRA